MSQISHAEHLSHFYVLLIAAKFRAHAEMISSAFKSDLQREKKTKHVEAVPFKGGDHSSAAQARQVQPDMTTLGSQTMANQPISLCGKV